MVFIDSQNIFIMVWSSFVSHLYTNDDYRMANEGNMALSNTPASSKFPTYYCVKPEMAELLTSKGNVRTASMIYRVYDKNTRRPVGCLCIDRLLIHLRYRAVVLPTQEPSKRNRAAISGHGSAPDGKGSGMSFLHR